MEKMTPELLNRIKELNDTLQARIKQIYEQLCFLHPLQYACGPSARDGDGHMAELSGLVTSADFVGGSVEDILVIAYVLDPEYPHDGPTEYSFPLVDLFDYQKYPADACVTQAMIDTAMTTARQRISHVYQEAVDALNRIVIAGAADPRMPFADFEEKLTELRANRLLYGVAKTHADVGKPEPKDDQAASDPFAGMGMLLRDLHKARLAIENFRRNATDTVPVDRALNVVEGHAKALARGPRVFAQQSAAAAA